MSELPIITFSLLDYFRKCRKMAALRYVEEIVPKKRNRAMYLGGLFHDGLDLWHKSKDWQRVESWLESVECEDRPMAWALIKAYVERSKPLTVVYSEAHFDGEFKWLPGVRIMGKVDTIAREGTDLLKVERKTASKLDGAYLEKLPADLQVQWYYLAATEILRLPLSGVLYDVVVKPGIRQCKGETDDTFRKRLFEHVELHREPLYVSHEDLFGAKQDIKELVSQWLDSKKRGVFYRNTAQCFQWGKPCGYWDLCRNHESELVRAEFYRHEPAHVELQPSFWELPK